MKKSNNAWQLSHWYEKVAYVVGIAVSAIWLLGFLVGVVDGILSA